MPQPSTEKKPFSMNEAIAKAQEQMRTLDPSNPEDEEIEDELIDESELGTAPVAQTSPPTAPQQAEVAAAPSAEAQPAPAPAAPEAAAPEAAAPADDQWAEYEEVEYEDPDSNQKYVVRAPKAYADKVKGGYQRRSLMDRTLGAYGKNKAWLQPLLESGQLNQIAPYIQQFTTDPDLANAAAEIIARRASGKPIRFADDASPPTAPPPAQEIQMPDLSQFDDYTRGVIEKAMKPIIEAQNRSAQEIATWRAQQEEQRNAFARQQQEQQRLAQLGMQVRFELQRRHPNLFGQGTDPQTVEVYQRVQNYVEQNGYVQTYGLTPAAWLVAADDMIGAGILAAPAPPAQSAAAEAIRNAETAAATLATRTRASVAAAVAPGAASAPAAPAPQPARKPPRFVKMANGKQRPLTPKELADWIEKQRAS